MREGGPPAPCAARPPLLPRPADRGCDPQRARLEGPRRSGTWTLGRPRRRIPRDAPRRGTPPRRDVQSVCVRLARAVAPRSIRQWDSRPASRTPSRRTHAPPAAPPRPVGDQDGATRGPGRQPLDKNRRARVPVGAHPEAAGHQAPPQKAGRSQQPRRQVVQDSWRGGRTPHHPSSQGSRNAHRLAPSPGHSQWLASNVATTRRATEAFGRRRDPHV